MSEYRLCKIKYVDRKTGESRESARWYIEFSDHLRTRHRWPLERNERDSRKIAERVMTLVGIRPECEAIEDSLQKWLDNCPSKLRERLVSADIIKGGPSRKGDPLTLYLEGGKEISGSDTDLGYRQHLLSQAEGQERAAYVEQTVRRVSRVFEGCGFVYWRELFNPGVSTRIAKYLSDLRKNGEISGMTINYYCREVRGFCRWMVDSGNATINPLSGLKGVKDAKVDKVETRSLSPEEMTWLLSVTASGTPWKRFEAADRALLYRVAFETGIRPGQLRQLTVSSFRLDGDSPHVVSKAFTVKRRDDHDQPIRTDLAQELMRAFANKMPDAVALPMPDKFSCAPMFRDDLRAARGAWIQSTEDPAEREKRHRSDFLAETDADGRRAIFYSLRHSHGVALGDAGVSQKDIATSLHHKKTSTTDRYVLKSKMSTQAKVVNQLPDVTGKPMELRKTGTHDAISVESPVSLRNRSIFSGVWWSWGGRGKTKNPDFLEGIGVH